MPRVRADDYEDKYQSILDSAAVLFAKVGYPVAKLNDVAKLCGASKSMLYHYFPAKDDLLLALLTEHLDQLIADIEELLARDQAPKKKFAQLVETFVTKSARSRQRHISAMNDLKFLPPDKQAPIIKLQRQVTSLIGQILREVKPGLRDEIYSPYTMLLVGMLNWTDLWYKPSGKMKPAELCELISRLYLRGILAERSD